jgi:dTDP-4-amino-4,6-dideoxygalactose transaminase
MTAIWEIAREHGLYVIEDAAHAIGSLYRGRPIGDCESPAMPFSNAVAFSFYATKNLTTGEGGMVTTADRLLDEKMRILCLHGINKDAWNRYAKNGSWYYEVVDCGFKYNLTDIQSAIGIHQLRKQEQFIAARARLAERYNEAFSGVPEVELPPDKEYCRNSWHLYALRLNLETLEINRAEFIASLKEKGIGASVHFIPIPLHPYFAGIPSLSDHRCPRALELYPRLVSLPLYPALDDEAADRVTASVTAIARASRKTKVFSGAGGLTKPPGREWESNTG